MLTFILENYIWFFLWIVWHLLTGFFVYEIFLRNDSEEEWVCGSITYYRRPRKWWVAPLLYLFAPVVAVAALLIAWGWGRATDVQ